MPLAKPAQPLVMTPRTVAAVRPSMPQPTAIGAVDNKVDVPSAAYDAAAKRRALPRALLGGTEAMREKGPLYMPQHPVETPESYQARLQSTVLFNAFSEAVARQAAKFFGEPLLLGEDVPEAILRLTENIDGQGRAITPFAIDLAREAFADGVSFILTDFPATPAGATMADQQQLGVRPYWVLLKADDVIGWRSRAVGGRQVLTQVRIRETALVPDGEFGEKAVKRVRVLEIGSWRLFEQQRNPSTGASDWAVVDEGVTSLPYIPLTPFYTNRLGYLDAAPPLRTLAEMNQEHWISSSEQRRALTFTRFAMLAVTGTSGEVTNVQVGPDKVLTLPTGADAKYVEHSGAGIAAGAADLEAIERRMQHAGMELRVENAGQVTATAAAIDSDDLNSVLRAIGKALEDALENGLQAMADFLRLPTGGSVEVADAFAGSEVPGSVLDLTSLRNSQSLSLTTLWDELKRRQVLGEDFDAQREMALIQEEAALFAGLSADLAAQFGGPPQPQLGPDGQPLPPEGGTPTGGA